MRRPEDEVVEALRAEGLVSVGEDGVRTTRRWQAAMARAAARLLAARAPFDLRLPVAAALVELVQVDDETLVRWVEVMVAVESGALRRTPDADAR
jgi:hypothetical protein